MKQVSREIIYDEVFDAQRIYRIILEAMARPGKIGLLPSIELSPPDGFNQGSALIGFTLLNADCNFCVLGPAVEEITPYLIRNTSSTPVELQKADFIFLPGSLDAVAISKAKKGTLSYPEEGASLVVDVEEIMEQESSSDLGAPRVTMVLKGPGVDSERQVNIRGLNPSILEKVLSQNQEFPLGIDIILTDKKGRLVCIPRSNRFLVGGQP
jgi:alpha-D-ribose 1-methylphosphonate 5-triphosphate synthase subunit PhnH